MAASIIETLTSESGPQPSECVPDEHDPAKLQVTMLLVYFDPHIDFIIFGFSYYLNGTPVT